MTRFEYLEELKRRLRVLPENEARDALNYYDGYLNDAGNDETAAIVKLGSPAEVAAQILASYAVGPTDGSDDKPKGKHKSGVGFVWVVIFAVFAAPIALPVALAVAIVALALLIVLVAVIFSVGVSGAALILGGVIAAVSAVIVMPQGFAVGIAALGAGLICIGVGIMLFRLASALTGWGSSGIARLVGETILRRRVK